MGSGCRGSDETEECDNGEQNLREGTAERRVCVWSIEHIIALFTYLLQRDVCNNKAKSCFSGRNE